MPDFKFHCRLHRPRPKFPLGITKPFWGRRETRRQFSGWLLVVYCLFLRPAAAMDLTQNLNTLLGAEDRLEQQAGSDSAFIFGPKLRIENCDNYPYHNHTDPKQGYIALSKDIRSSLKQGLECLSGRGSMGELHPYHNKQGARLLAILSSDMTKTFRCVTDETFAYAIAKAPPGIATTGLDSGLEDLPYPAVVLDTYRISGFLTRKHQPSTYREFFNLDEEQIKEHLTGKPLRLDGSHRYRNLPALLFHEMIHWLGHVHTNIAPDLTDLYETCCFGGDDHILDVKSNARFQQQACDILRDDELWTGSIRQQKRLWHSRGYDNWKQEMRAVYD